MSRLDELIAQLCPNGVEYRPIVDCTDKVNNIQWKAIGNTQYKYIDLTSVDRDTHQISDTQIINKDNAPSRAQQIVQTGDILLGATRPMLKRFCMIDETFDGQICSTGFCVLRTNTSIVLRRWLYHQISSTRFFDYVEKHQKGASYPAISDADVKSYSIPVPPIEIQTEIVRLLDNFTGLTAELTEKLTSELTARKEQYKYYLNKLLTHKIDTTMTPIGELGKWVGGKTPSMGNSVFWDDGTIPWISSKDMKTAILSDTEDHITQAAIEDAGMKLLPDGITVIVTRSGILKHTFPVAYVPFATTINQDIKALVAKDGVDKKYAFHVIQAYSDDIRAGTKKIGGTVDSLDFQKILEYEVPVPSMEIQKRLVNVLDNFEGICSDLNIGLSAEIEARKKQYEYYRDALLSFADSSQIVQVERERERERERQPRRAAESD